MANELEPFDIVRTGLARHGHQYGQSLLFRLWIAKTLNPLINVQDAFFELLDIDVDTAEGVKLALIGRIVGAPAIVPNATPIAGYFGFVDQDESLPMGELFDKSFGGYWLEMGQPSYKDALISESLYKTVIKAQILKNKSLCTPPEIINIAKMFIGEGVRFKYIEKPMAIILAPERDLTRYEIQLVRIMLPRPMGVGIAVLNGTYDDFGYKSQEDALPFGESDDSSIGGFWSTTREDMIEVIDEQDSWL
ncbi:hypothetical protein PSYG_00068 [Psychrobacter phage pOW20-A]|uniref:structural protein n=1 Tax=Psychrobacter phage pOW20-A TaxID=754048 RepID=UPI0002C17FC5|nr:structural protein [Psychrobacter phage pOW20-A]AGH57529.1 hypothetical protein PSYG_00068 [Psychrobacter phage pOW20-A]